MRTPSYLVQPSTSRFAGLPINWQKWSLFICLNSVLIGACLPPTGLQGPCFLHLSRQSQGHCIMETRKVRQLIGGEEEAASSSLPHHCFTHAAFKAANTNPSSHSQGILKHSVATHKCQRDTLNSHKMQEFGKPVLDVCNLPCCFSKYLGMRRERSWSGFWGTGERQTLRGNLRQSQRVRVMARERAFSVLAPQLGNSLPGGCQVGACLTSYGRWNFFFHASGQVPHTWWFFLAFDLVLPLLLSQWL